MTTLNRLRLFHVALATLAMLAYFTGELGLIHAWLGYGVAGVILLRLVWALCGQRQVGLSRFSPSLTGGGSGNILAHPAISKLLILGIAICLIVVTVTGISMDKGKSLGLARVGLVAPAYANNQRGEQGKNNAQEGSSMEETHELFANLFLLLVGLHITYLLVFKRSLAKLMLFIPTAKPTDKG
jgi:cytochrome b